MRRIAAGKPPPGMDFEQLDNALPAKFYTELEVQEEEAVSLVQHDSSRKKRKNLAPEERQLPPQQVEVINLTEAEAQENNLNQSYGKNNPAPEEEQRAATEGATAEQPPAKGEQELTRAWLQEQRALVESYDRFISKRRRMDEEEGQSTHKLLANKLKDKEAQQERDVRSPCRAAFVGEAPKPATHPSPAATEEAASTIYGGSSSSGAQWPLPRADMVAAIEASCSQELDESVLEALAEELMEVDSDPVNSQNDSLPPPWDERYQEWEAKPRPP